MRCTAHSQSSELILGYVQWNMKPAHTLLCSSAAKTRTPNVPETWWQILSAAITKPRNLSLSQTTETWTQSYNGSRPVTPHWTEELWFRFPNLHRIISYQQPANTAYKPQRTLSETPFVLQRSMTTGANWSSFVNQRLCCSRVCLKTWCWCTHNFINL